LGVLLVVFPPEPNGKEELGEAEGRGRKKDKLITNKRAKTPKVRRRKIEKWTRF